MKRFEPMATSFPLYVHLQLNVPQTVFLNKTLIQGRLTKRNFDEIHGIFHPRHPLAINISTMALVTEI